MVKSLFDARLLVILLPILVPGSALAGDGRVEINQARALAGGVTPGDAPGFPVTIDTPGSYVLTSGLTTSTPSQHGIELIVDDVTIDLNGFAIDGQHPCVQGSCSVGESSGIVYTDPSGGHRVTVHGGIVRRFGNSCIYLQDRAHVHHVVAEECGFSGIDVDATSLVDHNRVYNVGRWGLDLESWTPYAYNTIASFGLNGPGGTVQGGEDAGGNFCSDLLCKPIPVPRRHYYLTTGVFFGNQVTFACAATYHAASISELSDPSRLFYESGLGRTRNDSGEGPPHGEFGWIRTGNDDENASTAGQNNCDSWTLAGATDRGTKVELDTTWSTVPPWSVGTDFCGNQLPVWCVEN